MKKMMWFSCGLLVGLTALSICRASIPKVTDDTAIYQKLSEINVQKEAKRDLERVSDSDIERLSKLEVRYRERLKGPMERISHQEYRSHRATKSSLR